MKSMSKAVVQIQMFCADKEKVYIYGKGKFGQKCKKILDYLNICVQGYIVTNLSKEDREEQCIKDGIPIIQFDDFNVVPDNVGIIIAIDNAYEVLHKVKNRFKYTIFEDIEYSQIEITTKIGCNVNCKYCPQKMLINKYTEKSNVISLSMENFKKILENIPKVTNIRFCGMCEPFLNPECADMIVYAKESGYSVDCYSTLVGLKMEDVDRVMDAVDAFVPHLPDKERNAKIDVTDEYIEKMQKILNYKRNGQRLVKDVSVHGKPDDRIKSFIPEDVHVATWLMDRGGNLDTDEVLHYESKAPLRCQFCDNRLDCNIVLPNGDVLICCMDYGLEYVFGNLLESGYEKIVDGNVANSVKKSMIYGENSIICNRCSFAKELLG